MYCGKLAFGRRKNGKILETRNEYHVVKQNSYMLNDGIHEAIVPEELRNQVHKKRQEIGVGNAKTHSLDHEHILLGIIKCSICGSGMVCTVTSIGRSIQMADITGSIFIMSASTELLQMIINALIASSGMSIKSM